VLVWGIYRLARIVRSVSDQMVNKIMIIMHIAAYLFIIVVNISEFRASIYGEPKKVEIVSSVFLVVYFACSVIFGLIVN
jgi:hypothetical protein